jgi:hypothetical protein
VPTLVAVACLLRVAAATAASAVAGPGGAEQQARSQYG